MKRMTANEAHQRYISQAERCVEMLATISMSIYVSEPDKYDCLGAVNDFQAGLDRLRNPKPAQAQEPEVPTLTNA